MSESTPPLDDGMDFLNRMWSSMGFGLPGMVTPTLDVDELEKRINDLRTVEGWLKMNLSMLQMTIQGLEVQRATLAAVRAMSQPGEDGSPPPNLFANPALWAWPFPMPDVPAAAPAEPEAAPPDTPRDTDRPGAGARKPGGRRKPAAG